MDRPTEKPRKTEDSAIRRDEKGELIVDVGELRKEPVDDPANAAPSPDSPGMPGNTGGTGEEHTEQND